MCVKWALVYVCNRILQTFASPTEHMTLSFNKFTMRKEKRSAPHVLGTVFHPSATLQAFFIILRALKSNVSMKWRKWVVFRQVAPSLLSSLGFLSRHCVYYWRWVFGIIPLFLNIQNEPSFLDKSSVSHENYERRQREGAALVPARSAGGGRQLRDREKNNKKKTSSPFAIVATQARIMAALRYEDRIGISTGDAFEDGLRAPPPLPPPNLTEQ